MDFLKIAEEFYIDGTPVSVQSISGGLINDTMKIKTDTGAKYILQKINQRVMKNPPLVMENVNAVTRHLRSKGIETLTIIEPKEGRLCLNKDGEYYRMYDFIDNASCHGSPDSKEDFKSAGRAFGAFIEALSDMPVGKTHIIPNASHDTMYHLRRFKHAVEDDPWGRVKDVEAEVELAIGKSFYASAIQPFLRSGEIPLRIIHNDSKYSNIMIDCKSHKARCILDLDNVMPGTLLSDYGDSVRSGCDVDGQFCPELMLEYTEGFLESVKSITPKELELMPIAPLVITYENAIRYLTDYILGDIYFKIHYPWHNVNKFRKRMRLLSNMEEYLHSGNLHF